MLLTVDGAIFGRPEMGGIRRLHTEVLRRIPALAADVEIRLITEGRTAGPLPTHPRIHRRRLPAMERALRPGRLWRPLVPGATRATRRLAAGRGAGAIWHATYYARPVTWRGAEVVTVYDMIHERRSADYDRPQDEALRAAKRAAVEHADAVIAISRATADDLEDVYGLALGDRLHVVPLAPTRLAAGDPIVDRPYLLHVGGRAGYKGFAGLLAAYARWPGRHDVSLVSAGRPWTDDERRAITALGLSDRVQVVIHPDDDELGALYANAAALVQPSAAEGFGLTVVEAMAAGCPVVAARIPVTVEVGGDVPVYVEPGDVDALPAALDEAVGLDEARRAAGRAHVERYSWDATAAATLEIYRSIAP